MEKKFKNIVHKHKNSSFVTVDAVKMNALSKKEKNKPVKMPKSRWSYEKANKLRCKNCSMCGGCGLVFKD